MYLHGKIQLNYVGFNVQLMLRVIASITQVAKCAINFNLKEHFMKGTCDVEENNWERFHTRDFFSTSLSSFTLFEQDQIKATLLCSII